MANHQVLVQRTFPNTAAGSGFQVEATFTYTTTLGSGDTVTTDAISRLDVRRLVGSVFAATTGGTLAFQYSMDGVNWFTSAAAGTYPDNAVSITVTANTETVFDQLVFWPLFRVLYTNGAGSSGTFRFSVGAYRY